MKEVAVGIDIGGTFTKYGIVDKEGNCLINGSISTTQEKKLDGFLKLLKSTIDKAAATIKEAIEIKGYANKTGNFDINKKLAQNRAMIVSYFLKNNKVTNRNINISSKVSG